MAALLIPICWLSVRVEMERHIKQELEVEKSKEVESVTKGFTALNEHFY